MESLTPFVRHTLEDAPGEPAPPEQAGSFCSPPLGTPPDPPATQPPSQPDSPEVQLPPPEIPKPGPGVPTTDGTPVACRQKNAAEFLAGRSPGVMAQYGEGLFGAQQHCHAPSPAPEKDRSGVLQLVEWREEAPYG